MDPHFQAFSRLFADLIKRCVKICSQVVQLTRFGAHVLDFY